MTVWEAGLMAIRTSFTELFGVAHPLVLAPMGGASGGALAAAVSVVASAAGHSTTSKVPDEGACAGAVQPSANPAPMRLFHLSIGYLTLVFVAIAVAAVLPWGHTW